jgi:hypothetical protein
MDGQSRTQLALTLSQVLDCDTFSTVTLPMTDDPFIEFWDYGHQLFKTTSETFPAGFVAGDAFSPAVIEPKEPYNSMPTTTRPTDLRTLKSLTPLQGQVSAINASAFFHLFTEEKQLTLAKQLATLLSPEPGSIIFGVHAGMQEKRVITGENSTSGKWQMFFHSPESWVKLWEEQVFKPGSVKVDASLVQHERRESNALGIVGYWLVWSVTRF